MGTTFQGLDGPTTLDLTFFTNMTSTAKYAFSPAGTLTRIILPASVSFAGESQIPNGWSGTEIFGNEAEGSALSNYGWNAFGGYSTVVLYAKTPPFKITNGKTWYVPDESLAAYKEGATRTIKPISEWEG